MEIDDPNALVIETAHIFDEHRIPYALYGGLALAVYDVLRETVDVDHALPGDQLDAGIAAVRERFPSAQIAFREMAFGGLLVTRISVLPGDQPEDTGLNVIDIVTPRNSEYAKRIIERSLTGPLRGREVRVVAPEDLLICKILSTRESDLEDGARLLKAMASSLDLALVERELQELRESCPQHDLMQRWESVRNKA